MAGPADAYGYNPDTNIIQQGFELYRKNADDFIKGNQDNAIQQAMRANTDQNTGKLNEEAFVNAVRQIDANKALEYEKYFQDRNQQQENFKTQQANAQQTLKYNQLVYNNLEQERDLKDSNMVLQRLANAQNPAEIPGILDMVEKMGVNTSKWRNMPLNMDTLNSIKKTATDYATQLEYDYKKSLSEMNGYQRLLGIVQQGQNQQAVQQSRNEGSENTANINAGARMYSADKNFEATQNRTNAMIQNYSNNYDLGQQRVAQAKENLRLKGIQIQMQADYNNKKLNDKAAFGLLSRIGNLQDPSQIDQALNILKGAGVNVDGLQNMPRDANTLNILKDISMERKDALASDAKAKGLELRSAELEQRDRLARIATAKDRSEFSLKTNKEVNDIDQNAREVREEAIAQKANFDKVLKSVDDILADPLLTEFYSLPYTERNISSNGVYKTVTSGKYADLWSKIDKLKSLTFLQLAQKMKGLGPMSDIDAKNISAGMGLISPEISGDQVTKYLRDIIKDSESGIKNVSTDYTDYVTLLNNNRNDLLQNLKDYANPDAGVNINQTPKQAPQPAGTQQQQTAPPPQAPAQQGGETFLSASGVQQPAQPATNTTASASTSGANGSIIGSQLAKEQEQKYA